MKNGGSFHGCISLPGGKLRVNIDFPMFSHGFPIVFLCFSHFPVGSPWFSHGFPGIPRQQLHFKSDPPSRRWSWSSSSRRRTFRCPENDTFYIPLGISPLELPKSAPISTIFLWKIFVTFSLCTISCLPPLHGLLILEKLFVLDFRVFCVFQVWILRPRYLNSKNLNFGFSEVREFDFRIGPLYSTLVFRTQGVQF